MVGSPLQVTDEQLAAAQLRLVLDEKLGRPTPELVRRIAAMAKTEPGESEAASSPPENVVKASSPQDPRSHEIDCSEVLSEAWPFIDDEIDQDRRELLKRHLDECSSCPEEFALEEHLKALLAKKIAGDPAVDALKQRLRQILREILMRQTIRSAEVTVEQDDTASS